ncbi:MAG: hypothetical protein Q4G03_07035 [Planctomycetia bacterium]|nr:hypothetical protein [Planctomycetia bacterium]
MKLLKLTCLVALNLALALCASAQEDAANSRWHINDQGGITLDDFIDNAQPAYSDHIEASGEQVSTVLRYQVTDQGSFQASRSVVWPLLRTIPNNTHASLTVRFNEDVAGKATVNGVSLVGGVTESITLDGFLTVRSRFNLPENVTVERTQRLFPSTTGPFICERISYQNLSEEPITLQVPEYRKVTETDATKGVNGSYTLVEKLANSGEFRLEPNQSLTCDYTIQGFSVGKEESEIEPNCELEEAARAQFIANVWNALVLETPEPILNRAFAFAKIRASESIYRTAGGLMHGPGGESYYAAIWANDQAEYVNPFFPFLGYANGVDSAYNSFLHFARFMNDEYKPIPSSIIAEGIDIWNGAGDRGDAAMIAYGASRYALERADVEQARELWTLIAWCLEYCQRKLNAQGVVESDCDELERRFPAGNANLCTSCLYYDALLSAAYLAEELELSEQVAADYRARATALEDAIENYFGATVDQYDTYQYYEGCDKLRSWICMPLVVGIKRRAANTIDALFSDKLWTKNGLLTQEGSETFWDRSTLYTLRGVIAVGATEQGLNYLRHYSKERLLGGHVPYPIEAWPEGSQRHLSAESGLYCRVYTEGLFGIRPTGFHSFDITPRLPKEWNTMALKSIRAFGSDFDLTVTRLALNRLAVTVTQRGGVAYTYVFNDGDTVRVTVDALSK